MADAEYGEDISEDGDGLEEKPECSDGDEEEAVRFVGIENESAWSRMGMGNFRRLEIGERSDPWHSPLSFVKTADFLRNRRAAFLVLGSIFIAIALLGFSVFIESDVPVAATDGVGSLRLELAKTSRRAQRSGALVPLSTTFKTVRALGVDWIISTANATVDARKAGVATLGAPSAEPPSAPAAAVAEADPFAVGQRDHRLVVREDVYPGYSLLLNKCARPCRCVHLPGSARLGSD